MVQFDKATIFADPFGSMLEGYRAGLKDEMARQRFEMQKINWLQKQLGLGISGATRSGRGSRRRGRGGTRRRSGLGNASLSGATSTPQLPADSPINTSPDYTVETVPGEPSIQGPDMTGLPANARAAEHLSASPDALSQTLVQLQNEDIPLPPSQAEQTARSANEGPPLPVPPPDRVLSATGPAYTGQGTGSARKLITDRIGGPVAQLPTRTGAAPIPLQGRGAAISQARNAGATGVYGGYVSPSVKVQKTPLDVQHYSSLPPLERGGRTRAQLNQLLMDSRSPVSLMGQIDRRMAELGKKPYQSRIQPPVSAGQHALQSMSRRITQLESLLRNTSVGAPATRKWQAELDDLLQQRNKLQKRLNGDAL